jgi:hypothetical protein
MSDPVIIAFIGGVVAFGNLLIITGGAVISKMLDTRLKDLHTKVDIVRKEVNGQSQALLDITGKERFAAGQKQEKDRQEGEDEHSG